MYQNSQAEFDAMGTEQISSHAPGCGCSACTSEEQDVHHYSEGGHELPDDFPAEGYSLRGAKWGQSQTLGTTAGVVTWSIAGAGLDDLYNDYAGLGGGTTESLESLLSGVPDPLSVIVAQLKFAFAAWSAISGIQFVQVEDDGSDFTQVSSGGFLYGTNNSDIRIGANYIDGPSNTLAYGFYPDSDNYEARGNITFDSGETSFWNPQSFTIVAAHEIGHAIGIEHSADTNALMYPTYNPALTGLGADDIAAARAIYGTEANQDNNLYMRDSNSPLTLLEDFDGLIVNGTSGNDIINTAGGSQTIKAGAGNDTITTGAGDDFMHAGLGDDFFNGGITPLNDTGAGLDTLIFSGNFADYSITTGFRTDANGTYRVGLVTDLNTSDGDDGTDSFVNIDILQFNDISINLKVGTSGADPMVGTIQSDILVGFEGNDVFQGRLGSDFFSGGEGNDLILGHTFVSAGSSSDVDIVVYDGNYADYTFEQTSFVNANRGGAITQRIIVTDAAGGGFDGVDEGRDTLQDIEFIQFADQLVAVADLKNNINGTSASELVVGTVGNDNIDGLAGNDTIMGRKGSDMMKGGEGNDLILGHTFVSSGSASDVDTVVYNGNYADYTFEQTSFVNPSRGGAITQRIIVTDDLGGGSDGVNEGRDALQDIEYIQFADQLVAVADLRNTVTGTNSSEFVAGTTGNDSIDGLQGDDTIIGRKGSDLIKGGEGDDLIFGNTFNSAGSTSDLDTVTYDGNITDYTFSIDTVNLAARGGAPTQRIIVEDDASGGNDGVDEGRDRLFDIDFIQFADGNIIDVDALQIGTAGNDTLVGDARNNVFIGGTGADTSTGGAGLDAFYFSSLLDSTTTDTDVITDFVQGEDTIALFELNVLFSDLIISNDGSNTTVGINGTNFELQLNGVYNLTQDDFLL